jgi:hypothetical protein
VETGFLYRRTGSTSIFNFDTGVFTGVAGPVTVVDRLRINVFEVPILGKYYFRREEKVQPFLATGFAFRKGHAELRQTSNSPLLLISNNSYGTSLDVGATAGAGLRWRLGVVSLVPEIRYTYWGSNPNRNLSQNQADFLFGIKF